MGLGLQVYGFRRKRPVRSSQTSYVEIGTTFDAQDEFSPLAGQVIAIATTLEANDGIDAVLSQYTPSITYQDFSVTFEDDPEQHNRIRNWPKYLNRLVWPYAVNWKSQPVKEFAYNLRHQALGFVSPKYERFEQHAASGWQWEQLLESESLIDDFLAFTESLGGRLNGFWCPEPSNAFEIVGGYSGTQFYIRDIALRDTWDQEASQHVYFRKPGQQSQRAEITAVSQASDNRELVTVDTGVSVDATWEAHNLIYCRLAEDEESFTALADNRLTRSIKVIELPQEYQQIETGQKPVYLYAFWIRVPGGEHWWYATSLTKPVTSSGATYPSRAIEHGEWKDSIEGANESFEILSFYEDWNPMALFFPMKMPLPLWVRVFETTYADPNSRSTLFTGRVADVSIDGRLIRARCKSVIGILGRKFPRMMIVPRCNYNLYSTPCGIDKDQWKVVATISAIDGNIITVSGGTAETPDRFTGSPINRFARGYLETGADAGYEVRTVQKNGSETGGTMVLQLNFALSFAVVGQSVTFYAGCDGSVGTCRDQFNNFRNWGGHVIAAKNPVVKAIPIETSSGNKK